jgi:hypothetical protein
MPGIVAFTNGKHEGALANTKACRPQSYININRVSYRLLDWQEEGEAKKISIFVAFSAPSSGQI